MTVETDLRLLGGRTLHVYDTGADAARSQLTVFWHHGTPNIGSPPEPLFAASECLDVRWIGYDRPGYGGSLPVLNRNVASAATFTESIADAMGIGQFAVMGHSGGGPPALACAALLPGRVLGAVSMAGLAPYGVGGLDWFAGMNMNPSGAASLQAALAGRAAKEAHEASDPPFDPAMFTAADYAALEGPWNWLNSVVGPAQAAGPGGLIADDLAYVAPWGFELSQITCPVLLLHGGADRVVPASHSRWLARQIPSAELWLRPDDGHLSVLNGGEGALEWLVQQRR